MYVMIADAQMKEMLKEKIDYYLREVAHLTNEPLHLNEKGEALYAEFEQYFEEVDKHYPVLFIEEGEVIGFGLFSHYGYNTHFTIDEFYIDPDWRRQGKGTDGIEKLKGLILSIDKNPVIHVSFASSHPYATTFFERLGFEVTEANEEQTTLTYGAH